MVVIKSDWTKSDIHGRLCAAQLGRSRSWDNEADKDSVIVVAGGVGSCPDTSWKEVESCAG